MLDWLAAPVAGVLLFAFTRDAHAAVAAGFAAALVLLFSGGVGGPLLLFLLFALGLGRAVTAYCQRGETTEMATRRAIEDQGSTILFAGLAAVIAALPRGGIYAGLYAGVGLIAALILFPAFAGALRRIFPARRSVEDMYRAST